MQLLIDQLIGHGLRDRVLTERQLARVIGGTAARRYGLVNRALKADQLVRLRRGLYVLAPKFRTRATHPFALAQALESVSYISFETALSHHGWIPERTHVTASVVPGRKSSQLDHPTLGGFTFHPLAVHRTHFLELIERRQFDGQTALVAMPVRALMDLVTLRKVEWQGLGWLAEGMRIERQSLQTITRKQVRTLSQVYKHIRSQQFLSALARDLGLD